MSPTDAHRDFVPRPATVSRRQLLILAATGAGAALLAACGGGGTSPTTPATTAPTSAPAATTAQTTGAAASVPAAATSAGSASAAAGATAPAAGTTAPAASAGRPVSPIAASGGLKDTTITVIIFSGPEADTHTRLAPKFTEYTKGKVKVRIEEGGRGDAYDAKWLAGMQAKSTAWDVVHDNSSRFRGSGPAGFFVPLSKFMGNKDLFDAAAYNNEDFPKAERDDFSYKGEQMLMVQEASALLFVYRKDLLQKYGVPEPPPEGYDWDTYMGHLKTLKDAIAKDGKTDVYPVMFGAKKGFHSNVHIVQNGWANGGQLFNDIMPTFDDPKMIDAGQMVVDLLRKNKYVSEGMVGYEYPDVLTAFQTGKAATAFQWNAAAPTFLDAKQSPETAGKIAFAALPYFKGIGGQVQRFHPSSHAVGVSAFSKNQDEAFAYCAWFTSQDTARDYVTNGGGSSGRASLLSDKTILDKNPQYIGLNQELKGLHAFPPLEQYNYIMNTILAAHTSNIWTGQEDVKTGLSKAREEAIAYLKQEGVLK